MTDSEIIELLQTQLKTQQQQNEFLQKTIESLNQNIQSLTEEIADLKEKLNKDSHNSSKPPSSDGYKKLSPKSLRPKSDKKAGGQKGHKFSNLPTPKKIDRAISHYPTKCLKCPMFEKCLDSCYLDYYSQKYDEIIEIARKENPPPISTEQKRGRKKKGKVLALVERLSELKSSMLLFVRNFKVPFTNNSAEQTIRNLKSKSKVAGNFRSEDGASWYLKIRSYIDSARKFGINAFDAVKSAFIGKPDFCFGF